MAVEKILPTIEANETTMKAFERLTNQQAWHPFADTAITAIDHEEFSQFDAMEDKYKQNGRPGACNQHHYFANAWNLEVADQCKRYIDGDDSVVLIRRKCATQLQKHYDTLQQKKRLALQSDLARDQELWQQMRATLTDTHQGVEMPLITAPEVFQ